MITDIKNTVPFVSFGFGATVKEVFVGEAFSIFLESIFLEDDYRFFLDIPVGATYTEISSYEYEVVFSEHGHFNITMNVSRLDKSKALISNPLTITVI